MGGRGRAPPRLRVYRRPIHHNTLILRDMYECMVYGWRCLDAWACVEWYRVQGNGVLFSLYSASRVCVCVCVYIWLVLFVYYKCCYYYYYYYYWYYYYYLFLFIYFHLFSFIYIYFHLHSFTFIYYHLFSFISLYSPSLSCFVYVFSRQATPLLYVKLFVHTHTHTHRHTQTSLFR